MTDSSLPPQANPPVRGPRRRRGPLGYVLDSTLMAWRWLRRMRTALYLLAALAVLSMVATFVPQEPNVASTVAAWRAGEAGPGTAVSGVLDAVGAYDVYGSALFLALLLLLYIALTACLLPRIRAWIRLVRSSLPPVIKRPSGANLTSTFSTPASVDRVRDVAGQRLAGKRWRLRRHDAQPDGSAPQQLAPDQLAPDQLAAEKGLITREGGSLLFHVSFYVLLAAIVVGQLLTFEGQRGVIEGQPGFSDAAVSYWSYQPGRWFNQDDHDGWQLEVDEFHVDWVRDPTAPGAGQPTEFRSEVTVTPAGGEPYAAVIDSNEPLNIEGKRVTQLDWGYAPRVVVEVDGDVVHDGFIQPTAVDGGAFRGAVKAPAANPDLGLEVFFYPFAPDDDQGRPIPTGAPWDEAPMLLFRQYRGDLQLGATQQTVNELDTSSLESDGGAYLRPGQSLTVGDATISFPEYRRWVGFQISSRPALPAVLLGALLLLGGLIPALYAYRRRLWILVERDPESGSTLVTVTGRAFQRPEAFEQEHAELTAQLAHDLDGSTPDLTGAPEGPLGNDPDQDHTVSVSGAADEEVLRS